VGRRRESILIPWRGATSFVSALPLQLLKWRINRAERPWFAPQGAATRNRTFFRPVAADVGRGITALNSG